MGFFQTCGEIRYVRMAGDETQPTRLVVVYTIYGDVSSGLPLLNLPIQSQFK